MYPFFSFSIFVKDGYGKSLLYRYCGLGEGAFLNTSTLNISVEVRAYHKYDTFTARYAILNGSIDKGKKKPNYCRKCKELRISFTSNCVFPPVVIGEECIKLVKHAKLLGVTISGDLTWNAHITEITKKAAYRLYFLGQLKRARVLQGDLCLFYATCVGSVIDYAAPVFHHQPTFRMNWNAFRKEQCES